NSIGEGDNIVTGCTCVQARGRRDRNISHFLLRSNARVFREHMRLPYARKGFTAFCLSALPSIVKETYSQWGMNRKEAESVAGITRLDLAEKYPQR
ncbi:hypothetical protein, partial [Phaeobacter italicus]|uniref:hypothetical protein n=1 Tax=Phaeobacter italicus TaxID=481446 RepID=UPI001C98D9AB